MTESIGGGPEAGVSFLDATVMDAQGGLRRFPIALMCRVLLSDGSGLTARQVATRLDETGHRVEVLVPGGLPITRFTRHVRRLHRVPRYGLDPYSWLGAALDVAGTCRIDCLFPTQEQAALLARESERVRKAGLALPVPPFEALCAVQDKVSATATLAAHDVPQPYTVVARSRTELAATASLPAWVKPAIGTASTGVRLVRTRDELVLLAEELDRAGVLGSGGGAVVQPPVDGPLVMVQMVFSEGELVAFHANLRVREGQRGGASVKESVDIEPLHAPLAHLGRSLGWHGALSCDAILSVEGPVVIDVNPRLVEPANAWHSGVDLVGAMLGVAFGEPVSPMLPGRVGVRTHQLLLAVLGAAQKGRGRRGILEELVNGLAHRGPYRHSCEELTPLRGDLRAAVPVIAATLATLSWPDTERFFGGSAVSSYALTAPAWERILTGP